MTVRELRRKLWEIECEGHGDKPVLATDGSECWVLGVTVGPDEVLLDGTAEEGMVSYVEQTRE